MAIPFHESAANNGQPLAIVERVPVDGLLPMDSSLGSMHGRSLSAAWYDATEGAPMPSRETSVELLRRIADVMGVGIEAFTEGDAVRAGRVTPGEEAVLVAKLLKAFEALGIDGRRHAVRMIETLAGFEASKG